MSCISHDREKNYDSSDMIFVVLTPSSAIVTSRKRKLRELFAVATHADGQSHDAFANPDAPPSTPAEGHFLQANEIFQYVGAIDPCDCFGHSGAFAAWVAVSRPANTIAEARN